MRSWLIGHYSNTLLYFGYFVLGHFTALPFFSFSVYQVKYLHLYLTIMVVTRSQDSFFLPWTFTGWSHHIPFPWLGQPRRYRHDPWIWPHWPAVVSQLQNDKANHDKAKLFFFSFVLFWSSWEPFCGERFSIFSLSSITTDGSFSRLLFRSHFYLGAFMIFFSFTWQLASGNNCWPTDVQISTPYAKKLGVLPTEDGGEIYKKE